MRKVRFSVEALDGRMGTRKDVEFDVFELRHRNDPRQAVIDQFIKALDQVCADGDVDLS